MKRDPVCLFVFDGRDEAGELFERTGDDQLVVRLVGTDALELEVLQGGRQPTLGLGQHCKKKRDMIYEKPTFLLSSSPMDILSRFGNLFIQICTFSKRAPTTLPKKCRSN